MNNKMEITLRSIFRCLGNFIFSSSRVIVFIGCLGLALIQLIRMANVSNFMMAIFQVGTLSPPTASYNPFYNPIGILVIACLGALGVFFNHKAFKLFPILLALCVFMSFYSLANNYDEMKLKELDESFKEKFEQSMHEYKWYKWSNPQPAANEYIDAIQNNSCCGFEKPDEWDALRPSDLSNEYFPLSCCKSNELAKECYRKEAMEQKGCNYIFLTRQGLLIFGGIIQFIYMLFLFPISIISSSTCCSQED